MKRTLLLCLCLTCSLAARTLHAQSVPADVIQEMQRADPQAALALSAAIQRGDFQTAKKIYDDYRSAKSASSPQPVNGIKPAAAQGPALFERTLSGLPQFGYDLFNKTVASFSAPATMPVGPDYIIGPGDQFTLTLWGTTEGIYALQVTKEGKVTLPKVGVISVAGLRFGELEQTLKRHLSKYYSNFNLSVAMGGLKTLTVYVVGEVSVPGSYSLPSLTTVYGALFAAGGPTKQGTLRAIRVLRSGKVIKTIDLYEFLLNGDRSQDIRLQHEDTVFVPLIGSIAGVSGAVYRPAIYELKGQDTIGDLIKTAGGIMPMALGGTLQLTRYVDNQKKVFLDIKLDDQQPGPQNPAKELGEKIRNMDTVSIKPLYDKVWETVNLQGDVRNPGEFQWRQDLRLKEIIQDGQLLPTADLKKAEIIRLTDDYKDRTVIPVNLASLMDGDESQNVPLRPRDQIRVYTLYREVERATVTGEVMSPGVYEIQKGERLSDLLRRVGGFTPEAYAYGAVFKRRHVKAGEDRNLKSFNDRMQTQMLMIAAGSVATAVSTEEASSAKGELSINQSLLENLKALQAQNEGRVAINITEKIDEWAGFKDDLVLQDGDSLLIPKRPQEVLIIGEVYSPGAQVFLPELSVKDYLDRSGGTTKYADSDHVFVVQANGFAFGADSPNVGNIEKAKLKAGDAIFVPQKMERYATMRTTKDLIDILFKTAVVIATITILF